MGGTSRHEEELGGNRIVTGMARGRKARCALKERFGRGNGRGNGGWRAASVRRKSGRCTGRKKCWLESVDGNRLIFWAQLKQEGMRRSAKTLKRPE